ncbi:hypothetical protein [Mucilaginibacter glaciei]|uniref:Uncharacterized protein n=1 Tax=Mucilaginibacter glaciei TaxID=2772109 RepID=A0A926NG33_9SPHI|nr:hypothetical protein [Mucilaginibacter glaciei]MBD1391469.1 hypothetical protein [Mucilaginibacter glaciei]
MKKIIIAAALIFSTGILPSCTKQTPVQTTATLERSTIATKKDVGTAD